VRYSNEEMKRSAKRIAALRKWKVWTRTPARTDQTGAIEVMLLVNGPVCT